MHNSVSCKHGIHALESKNVFGVVWVQSIKCYFYSELVVCSWTLTTDTVQSCNTAPLQQLDKILKIHEKKSI